MAGRHRRLIEAEIEARTEQLTARVRVLTERYGQPLPEVSDRDGALESAVPIICARWGSDEWTYARLISFRQGGAIPSGMVERLFFMTSLRLIGHGRGFKPFELG